MSSANTRSGRRMVVMLPMHPGYPADTTMQRRTDHPRRAGRPVTDRWAFKPVALLLLAATVAASSAAAAVILAPPFLAAGIGVRELDRRLEEAGSDFTRIPRFPQRSTIYANDGKTVLAQVYLDNREIVDLKDVNLSFRRAVLAIEDSDFYEHGALDMRSMFRAAVENVREREIVQGGSTITQQLVKNTLGLDASDQSLERKFQELALALRVEERYKKNRILSMYVNQVYLGNNVYGIGTASQFYFHKPASELSLRQAALLAGMIRAPAYYDPLKRPKKALLRRNDVLNRMEALGWLGQERGDEIERKGLGLPPDVGELHLPKPPFLVSFVKDQILEGPLRLVRGPGADAKGPAAIAQGGRPRHRDDLRPGPAAAGPGGGRPALGANPDEPDPRPARRPRPRHGGRADRGDRHDALGQELSRRREGHRHDGAPAGIVVQAVHPGGGLPQGHPAHIALLGRPDGDRRPPVPQRGDRRGLVPAERGGIRARGR